MKNSKSRRTFLKNLAAGAAGIAVANKINPSVASQPTQVAPAKSKVVLIKNPDVIDAEGNADPKIIREMIDAGMKKLTEKDNIQEAWQEFFTEQDIVGVKLNALGLADLQDTPYVSRFSGINEAIISSLDEIGVKKEKVIFWDRSNEELISAGLAISKDEGKPQIKGIKTTPRGEGSYNQTSYPVGANSTRVCDILADECTALINVPVLKTHRNAGISGSLKNHYGTIDNPREFHANYCNNPGIAEVNMVKPIQEKQRLIICDALMGLYDGGPRWAREVMWTFGGIILGTDPVAVDSIMLKIINQKRKDMALEPVETATHIPISEGAGLGNHSLAMISLEEVVV